MKDILKNFKGTIASVFNYRDRDNLLIKKPKHR